MKKIVLGGILVVVGFVALGFVAFRFIHRAYEQHMTSDVRHLMLAASDVDTSFDEAKSYIAQARPLARTWADEDALAAAESSIVNQETAALIFQTMQFCKTKSCMNEQSANYEAKMKKSGEAAGRLRKKIGATLVDDIPLGILTSPATHTF